MNNKKMAKFLAERQPETPYLIVDLDVVGQAYKLLRRYMPLAKIFYAVKANPAPEVVGLLRDLGSNFDVASRERDRSLHGAGRRRRPHLLRQHDQEGARYRLRLRAGRAPLRLRQRVRAREAGPVGARQPRLLPHPGRLRRAPNGRCRANSAARPRWRSTCCARPRRWASIPMASPSMSARSRPTSTSGTARSARAAKMFLALAETDINLRMVNVGGGFPAQLPRRRARRRALCAQRRHGARSRGISATTCPRSSSSPAARWSAMPA